MCSFRSPHDGRVTGHRAPVTRVTGRVSAGRLPRLRVTAHVTRVTGTRRRCDGWPSHGSAIVDHLVWLVHESVHERGGADATGGPSGKPAQPVGAGSRLKTRCEGDLGSSQWGFDSPRPHPSPHSQVRQQRSRDHQRGALTPPSKGQRRRCRKVARCSCHMLTSPTPTAGSRWRLCS